jgi:hypothetical protein
MTRGNWQDFPTPQNEADNQKRYENPTRYFEHFGPPSRILRFAPRPDGQRSSLIRDK